MESDDSLGSDFCGSVIEHEVDSEGDIVEGSKK